MTDNWLNYERMVEQALRSVVRKALSEATHRGLPGEHHFYIKFHTDRPNVGIAEWLRQQYPDEMTIILQHQFWDLVVEEDRFAVTLSFGGRHERLTVPYAAIATFADPSVKFGLNFEANEEELQSKTPSIQPAKQVGKPAAPPADAEDPHKGADVVALDAFRKK